MSARVVHCKRDPFDVYIGRANPRAGLAGSKFANPFKLPSNASDTERQACIERYETWLRARPELVEAAQRDLRGKVLGCWCAPKACHGDVLVRITAEARS